MSWIGRIHVNFTTFAIANRAKEKRHHLPCDNIFWCRLRFLPRAFFQPNFRQPARRGAWQRWVLPARTLQQL